MNVESNVMCPADASLSLTRFTKPLQKRSQSKSHVSNRREVCLQSTSASKNESQQCGSTSAMTQE